MLIARYSRHLVVAVRVSSALFAPKPDGNDGVTLSGDFKSSASMHVNGRAITVAVDLTPVLPGGDNGGARIFATELIAALSKLRPRSRFLLLTSAVSHDELAALDAPNVRRICVRDTVSEASNRNDVIVRSGRALLARLPAFLLKAIVRLRLLLLRTPATSWKNGGRGPLDADLLFCPFGGTTLAEASIPAVATLHDLQYSHYPQFFPEEDVAHRDAVFRHACRDASRVVAISDFTRASAIATERIEPERVVTIRHRLANRFQLVGNSNADDAVSDITHGRPYVLYPSNFWRHKNHEMLFTALGVAVAAGLPEEFLLVCTGAPGDRMDFLKDAARRLGLSERIVFPGYVEDAHIGALMRGARGLLFPSLYEGFGMPVLEAMALGVPVACSNTTALPEITGDAALLFDPRAPAGIAEAIRTVATDDDARDRLSRAGLRRAREFADVNEMALAYWKVFEEVLVEGARSTRINGLFPDGWLSPLVRVEINLPVRGTEAELVLDIEAPEWLPAPKLRLRASQGRRRVAETIISKGARTEIRIPVKAGGLKITISPGFSPSDYGISPDTRTLALRIHRCEIRSEGWALPLWPEDLT